MQTYMEGKMLLQKRWWDIFKDKTANKEVTFESMVNTEVWQKDMVRRRQ